MLLLNIALLRLIHILIIINIIIRTGGPTRPGFAAFSFRFKLVYCMFMLCLLIVCVISCLFLAWLCRLRLTRDSYWAVTFIPIPIPMPMPKRICRTCSDNKWVHDDVCITCLGQGHGYEYDSPPTANLQTNILDFRGFDQSRILRLRVGIPRPAGNFPESLSQRILVGIILVGRY